MGMLKVRKPDRMANEDDQTKPTGNVINLFHRLQFVYVCVCTCSYAKYGMFVWVDGFVNVRCIVCPMFATHQIKRCRARRRMEDCGSG